MHAQNSFTQKNFRKSEIKCKTLQLATSNLPKNRKMKLTVCPKFLYPKTFQKIRNQLQNTPATSNLPKNRKMKLTVQQ